MSDHFKTCVIEWVNRDIIKAVSLLRNLVYDAKHTVKLEIGKHYRTEDGRVYKVIHEDDDGHWTANIREGISQRHPVIITDAWGRNRFGQDLIEEVTL